MKATVTTFDGQVQVFGNCMDIQISPEASFLDIRYFISPTGTENQYYTKHYQSGQWKTCTFDVSHGVNYDECRAPVAGSKLQ